jgi:hypothetical protein
MIPELILLAISLVPPLDTIPKPRLIAKGETDFVHIVPPAPSGRDRAGRPMQVTHTRRDTGEMTILASATAASPWSEFSSDWMRSSWDTRTIGGVRADNERIYVLTTHSVGFSTPAMGAHGTTTAELRVFWLADGSRVGTYPLENPGQLGRFGYLRLPGDPPDPDSGLLKADVNGVAVAGEVFRFKGKQRVAAVADSPTTPRPALSYISSQPGHAIHAVHPLPLVADLKPARGSTPGTTILYVPFQAAQARVLIQTGDREHREKGARGLLDPARVTQTRVVGAGCDTERLYVLVWHSEWTIDGGGALRAEPQLRDSDDYRLYVFWLADGSDLAVINLTGGKKGIPEESVARGLVEVFAGGVKVFGETIQFKGKERVKEK